MRREKILVTGGLGYIGSHTVVELINLGYQPIIIDNLNNSYRSVLDRIASITNQKPEFVEGDVTNAADIDALFKTHTDIRAVIHFAAFKAVGESVQQPLKYYRNNVAGLITLLECMAKAGVKNIVFSSSCTVYGDTDLSPVHEDIPIARAASPYGNTKIICEDMLRDESLTGAVRVVSLRYFNPVGAHESALIGELPLGVPNNLIPYITQTAAGIREQLTIYGDNYPTPDGTCIRDYIHVVDLAKAHVKALERFNDSDMADFEVFNLGTGNGNSVLEVVQCFERVNGLKLNYRFGERRAGDVVQIWADTRKAEDILGWKAELGLEDMMRSAWNWQRSL
ncbi:MAG: UDP-glucose 4-epimerase GalE [Flavobacteriales bacterium]|nr:UDP-glucose 4-epimerase GalE [Flavobacteriales bacterium]